MEASEASCTFRRTQQRKRRYAISSSVWREGERRKYGAGTSEFGSKHDAVAHEDADVLALSVH